MNSKGISMGKILNMVPGYSYLTNTKAWKTLRYRVTLKKSERINDNYTQFLRLPTQFVALNEIIKRILDSREGEIEICVLGCSDGSEPYSISSNLLSNFPTLPFSIKAFDIVEDVIDRAKKNEYTKEHIYDNRLITDSFIQETFDIRNDVYRVKRDVHDRVQFAILDVLDTSACSSIGRYDIVFAQNFLFHLDQQRLSDAFENIYRLMKEDSFLFIDGVDLVARQELTAKLDLIPYDFQIERIHDEARQARGGGWPYHYWGLEPFSADKKEWKRLYATIFRKTAEEK